jgi:hypothetical protein
MLSASFLGVASQHSFQSGTSPGEMQRRLLACLLACSLNLEQLIAIADSSLLRKSKCLKRHQLEDIFSLTKQIIGYVQDVVNLVY